MSIKATFRNGRAGKNGVYSANHNTRTETRAKQSHIDSSRTKENIYFKFENNGKAVRVQGGYDSRAHELSRYEYLFGKGIEAQNQRHKDSRHAERCRTVEQVYQNKRTAPMETILQVGNTKSNLTAKEQTSILYGAVCDLANDLKKRYGKSIQFLDMSIHLEESVPHCHFRYVFACQDRGYTMPNQSKALKEMGFEAPDKDKPRSRYNNPLISFTDATRERFYGFCEARGVEIDREVKSPSKRHQERQESRCEALQQKIDQFQKFKELFIKKDFPEIEKAMLTEFVNTHQVRRSSGGKKPIRDFYEDFLQSKLISFEKDFPEAFEFLNGFKEYHDQYEQPIHSLDDLDDLDREF